MYFHVLELLTYIHVCISQTQQFAAMLCQIWGTCAFLVDFLDFGGEVLCELGTLREGRTWAMTARRGSEKSLFPLSSEFGPFPQENKGKSVLNFCSLKNL